MCGNFGLAVEWPRERECWRGYYLSSLWFLPGRTAKRSGLAPKHYIFNNIPKPGGNSLLTICRDNLEPARQAGRGGSLRGDQPRYPDRDLVEDMAVEDRRSYLPSLPSGATISFPKVWRRSSSIEPVGWGPTRLYRSIQGAVSRSFGK